MGISVLMVVLPHERDTLMNFSMLLLILLKAELTGLNQCRFQDGYMASGWEQAGP